MTTMTTIAEDAADDRRRIDRRKGNLAFEGHDRRVAERRAVGERRASHA